MASMQARPKSTPQRVATKIVADPEAQHRQLHFYNCVREYAPGQQFVFMFIRSDSKESRSLVTRFAEVSRVEKTQHCFIAFVSDEPPAVLDSLRKTVGFLAVNVISDVHRMLFRLLESPLVPTVVSFSSSGAKYFEEHAGTPRLPAAFVKRYEPDQINRVEQALHTEKFIGSTLLHMQSHRVAQQDIDATLKRMEKVPWSAHRGSIQDCTVTHIPQMDLRARSVPQNVKREVVNYQVVFSPRKTVRTDLLWVQEHEPPQAETDHVEPARIQTYANAMPVDVPDTITLYHGKRFREARDQRQLHTQRKPKPQPKLYSQTEQTNFFPTELPDAGYHSDLPQKIKDLNSKRTRHLFGVKQNQAPLQNPMIEDIYGLVRHAEKYKPSMVK